MTIVYTYRIEKLTTTKHRRLETFFTHLTWLYNQGVEYCRAQYAEGEKTPSYYDLCKWLTGKRGEDTRTGQWNVPCQRSVPDRARRGYDKFFRDRKGLPRFKSFDRGVRSFETEAAKPRKHPNGGHYVQIKGLGRLSFTDRRGVLDAATVKIVRIVRTPLHLRLHNGPGCTCGAKYPSQGLSLAPGGTIPGASGGGSYPLRSPSGSKGMAQNRSDINYLL